MIALSVDLIYGFISIHSAYISSCKWKRRR